VPVQLDDIVQMLRPKSRHTVRDARAERADGHGHPMHLLHTLEAIHAFDRESSRRRSRHDYARLVDAVAEDRDERLGLAAREARPKGQRFHDQRAGDDLVAARRGPPARLLDLGRIDIRERVSRHQAIALKERARSLG
jgi:hypothetical protein